jgi:hypothetical protein
MTRPKAQTLIQRYGFADPDLKDQKHDDAVIGLTKPENRHRFLCVVAGVNPEEYAGSSRFMIEHPVNKPMYNNSPYLIGFVDLLISGHVWPKGWDNEAYEKEFDAYLKDHKGFTPGKTPRPVDEKVRVSLAIEVKTKPVTCGELLRQINTYRQYSSDIDHWAVYFTNSECSYADALSSQGVWCFHGDEKQEEAELPTAEDSSLQGLMLRYEGQGAL